MLSLCNGTGRDLIISDLDGLEVKHIYLFSFFFKYSFLFKFEQSNTLTSINLKANQTVPLIVPNERQSAARLSVIEEQDFKRRKEFSVKVKK